MPAAADSAVVGPPTSKGSWVARVVVDTNAVSEAGGKHSVGRVHARTPWSGAATQMKVVESAVDAQGVTWIKVLLARKPNGSFGWIPADYAQISHTAWRVRVDISSRRITAYRAGRRVRSSRAVVGAHATPTPVGSFAIREIVKQPNPGGFSGPWILHLNANSEKLKTFEGSDAVIGIHGRAGASLNDPLGSARSHGCIRIPNGFVRYLARHLVAGAPVEIVR